MTSSTISPDDPKEDKRQLLMSNIRSILFYSLAMTVSLGFTDLITSIFDSFPNTKHIISKTTYVVILFGLTIFTAYYVGQAVII
jgi:hypothetical protein